MKHLRSFTSSELLMMGVGQVNLDQKWCRHEEVMAMRERLMKAERTLWSKVIAEFRYYANVRLRYWQVATALLSVWFVITAYLIFNT
jgi:hypothetical protein